MRDDESCSVWPSPQTLCFTGERLPLFRPLRVTTRGNADWLPAAARQVSEVLNGAVPGIAAGEESGDGPLLLLASPDGLPARFRPEPVCHPEGYALSVDAGGVVVAAAEAPGAFYAAQTLAQLVERGPEPFLPGVAIRDWPAFPMRGAHLYLPPRAHLDFLTRLLDFLAGLKCNLLILEFGGGMEYERHPEINEAWRRFCREAMAYDPKSDPHSGSMASRLGGGHPTGPVALQGSRYFPKDSIHPELAGGDCLTKDEVRQIVAECACRHIEVVPEVQALSHSYYLCMAHPEVAERADDPWPDTYCPSNPKSYALLFDVMEEVIEVVNPRLISIGHDEAYTFRVCPECRKRPAYRLLADEIVRCHDFLASRGIRTAMWGDKLMDITTPEGRRYGGVARRRVDPATGKQWVQPATWRAADLVPKDILIVDWYWSLDPRSERNFRRHGFEVLYGNFHPLRFEGWDARSAVPYVHGAEMSSWCEVSPEAFGHNGTFHNFYPGADMLWRGRQMERDEVCDRMARQMPPALDTLMGERRWLVSGTAGDATPLDLSPAARPVPAALAGVLATGEQPATPQGLTPFRLLVNASGCLDRALVLDVETPASGPIPVARKAERLLLLAGTTMERIYYRPTYYSFHRGPAELLRCRVAYADGSEETLTAIYGEDVGPVQGAWPAPNGGHCYRAVPVAAGPAHTLYAWEWKNPYPDREIAHLELFLGPDSADTGEVIVAGVSVVVGW